MVEQLAGAPLPASALESLVLPARVVDYRPELLDELTASGEVLWAGAGAIAGQDGWISLHLADSAHLAFVHTNTLGGSEEYAYVTKPVDLDQFMNAVRQIDEFFVQVVRLPQF